MDALVSSPTALSQPDTSVRQRRCGRQCACSSSTGIRATTALAARSPKPFIARRRVARKSAGSSDCVNSNSIHGRTDKLSTAGFARSATRPRVGGDRRHRTYPTWWGGVPALLKGFLDRVLHPGFAFVERADGGWKGLLNGRAALLVTTMDTPRWIYRWLLGAPGDRAMRDATLGFCGIAPIRILSFGPVRTSTLAERRRWLACVAREGRRLRETFRTGWRVKLRAWIAVSRLHFYVQPWLGLYDGRAGDDCRFARRLALARLPARLRGHFSHRVHHRRDQRTRRSRQRPNGTKTPAR